MKWKELLEIRSGKNQKSVIDPNGQYPIYGSGGIIGYATEYLCPPKTTIVGRKGTINSPIFVNESFWNVDTAFGLIPSSKLLPKYLYYFCCHFNFTALDKSTTIPSLAKRDLENIDMNVPSLDEQSRIVSRIDELFSELDKAVDTLKTTKEQLAVYRQAVLKSAFENDGESTYLGTLIEKPRYGTSKKCSYNFNENSTAVIRIPNIDANKGIVDSQDLKYAEFDSKELKQFMLQTGDILIIRSNGSISLVGAGAMVRDNDTDKIYAGYLMRLRIADYSKLMPQYLLHYLSSPNARRYIENTAKSTSGVNNINSQEISKLQIPMVSIKEQARIVAGIEEKLSIYDKIESIIVSTFAQTDVMRQSILKQAFEEGIV